MRLVHLSLRNFRLFREVEADLPGGLVLLSGGNAQGKSTLLEAIYLLAVMRSVRAEREREMVSFSAVEEGAPYARVMGKVQRQDGTPLTVQIDMALLRRGEGEGVLQKKVRVNGSPRLASGAVGEVAAVLFSPEDIALVTGAPALRRRYLDLLLSQVDRDYASALHTYQRVLSQRNALLERAGQGQVPPEEAWVWDEELCRVGALLTVRRREVVSALAPVAGEFYASFVGGQEALEVRYAPSVEAEGSEEEVAERLRARLGALRPKELAQGQTLAGPHRDDLLLTIGGRDAGTYGSRGQARTSALALRLAEARFLAGRKGEEPVLLLDDLLSELDSRRRAQVLETVSRAEQAFLTVVDTDLYPGLSRRASAHFTLGDGRLEPTPLPSPLGP